MKLINNLKIGISKPLSLLALLALSFNLQAEPGVALKADSLRAEPFADAKTVTTINKNDALDILGKKGAWLQVQKGKNKGWVRLLSVKRGNASSGNQLGGAVDVATGRAGTGKVVSTTGIRGLSAEELKAAKFNEDEMKKMESFASSVDDAQKFGAAGGLSMSKLAYLKGGK